MKRTIVWPPRLDGGRLAMTADPEDEDAQDPGQALRQIVALAVRGGSSAHPWHDPDDADPTFARGPASEARIRLRVRRVFDRLERTHRARLADLSIRRFPGGLAVQIAYTDLETGGRQSMEITR